MADYGRKTCGLWKGVFPEDSSELANLRISFSETTEEREKKLLQRIQTPSIVQLLKLRPEHQMPQIVHKLESKTSREKHQPPSYSLLKANMSSK